MKKSEMAEMAANYHDRVTRARQAGEDGDYAGAIKRAASAWGLVDAMLKHDRSESRESESIEAFDLVAEYAPPAMDFRSLNDLETFLSENKRLARFADGQPTARLTKARALMWDAHRLWTEIERSPGLLQSSLPSRFGKPASHWTSIVAAWNKMRLVERQPDGSSFRLSLATRLGQLVSGKCPGCGHKEEVPKAMFLDKLKCPQCMARVLFVILH
jgi:hypothetical protein